MTTVAKTSPLYFSMQAIWGVEFLRTLSTFKKRIEIRRLMVTSFKKRRIRRFHVIVVLWTSNKCTTYGGSEDKTLTPQSMDYPYGLLIWTTLK